MDSPAPVSQLIHSYVVHFYYFFFGKARKASLILRMFLAVAVACAKDLADVLPLMLLFFSVDWNLDFLNCSLVGREKRGGETFLAILL